MRIEFDDGTLLLRDAPEDVPHAEWDDRVDEYRALAYRYQTLLEWAGTWTGSDDQATLRDGFGAACEDAARAYPDLELTPALHIEPRDYQQAALDAWIDHGRRGSVVLPVGTGAVGMLACPAHQDDIIGRYQTGLQTQHHLTTSLASHRP